MEAALSVPPDPVPIPLTDDRLIGVAEVARRLDVNRSTVYRWLHAGSFPTRAFRIGRTWRIDALAFDAWLSDQ